MYRILLLFVLFCCVIAACSESDPGPVTNDNIPPFLNGPGLYLLNEGNFTQGNGSLSFFSYDSTKLYNNVFSQVNGRALGDVPNSIKLFNGRAFIVVNNSGSIEVTDQGNMISENTITGLISPRNIAFTGNKKAYVSSLYSKSMAVVELTTMSVLGYIRIGQTSESISVVDDRAFVSNWASGNKIFIINTLTNTVTDSVVAGPEPESMVVDKNKKIWILCNGGYARDKFAELIAMDPATYTVIKRLIFPDKTDSPMCLQIDGTGEVLYYLEKGVKKMNINDPGLPAIPFINESTHLFYKLAVNEKNGDIFVTDAVDYRNKGYLLHYNKDGVLLNTYTTEIIPGAMCFK